MATKPELDVLIDTQQETEEFKSIVVYNDDVNSFDWVIICFESILGLSEQDASECAFIIHTEGKCAVKSGSIEELKPLCLKLLNAKLNAKIED
jgi:ATP-dependent Clp protease adaptor protein ClpS